MQPLVWAPWLIENLGHPQVRLVDCRFSLTDPLAGELAYRQGHIPGAVYANLETDLSGTVQPDRRGGRHPLPSREEAAQKLAALGLGSQHLVVVYDDSGMVAPRLWWMLRWLGHTQVAVLNGGIRAYQQAGGRLQAGWETAPAAHLELDTPTVSTVDAQQVAQRPAQTVLIDSRAPERYEGRVEPLDPRAGHIPGALNHNWAQSLDAEGYFKSPPEQLERFGDLAGREVMVYCGSGVSACANILALELMGVKAQLYPGSWSDWVSDPDRPIQTGQQP